MVATPHEIAFAGVALQVGNAMALLSMVGNFTLAPELARLHAAGDRAEMARLCRLMSLTASAPVLPVVIYLWTVGGTLCGLALGPSYREAAFPLAIACTSRFLMAMLASSNTALMMAGHTMACVVVQTSGVMIGVLATALVYPVYGFHAALVAAAALNVLQQALLAIEARRRLGFWALPFV